MLLAAGEFDLAFGGTGHVNVNFFGSADPAGARSTVAASALAPDGKVVVAGDVYVDGGSGPKPGLPVRFGVERLNPDGTPDPTFGGGDGGAVLVFPDVVSSTSFSVKALGLGTDGKIVVVAQVQGPNDPQEVVFGVARLNPDGTPDPTFDGDGFARYPFLHGLDPKVPVDLDQPRSVAVGPDGSIVIAGSGPQIRDATSSQDDMMLVRIKPDGTLDTSFENGPRFTTIPLEPGLNLIDFHDISGAAQELHDEARVVRRLGDGSYLVAGTTRIRTAPAVENDFAVAKLKPDGGLDPTFGRGGRLTFNIQAGSYEAVSDLVVQADGKIVLMGQTAEAADGRFPDIAVIRLNPDGTFDPTFDGDGVAVIGLDASSRIESPGSVTILPDGKIAIVGSSVQDAILGNISGASFVLRLNPDGSRDPGYGTNGVARFGAVSPVPGTYGMIAFKATIQPDGKIVGIGASGGFGMPTLPVVFRLVADTAPAGSGGDDGRGGGGGGGGTTTGGGGGTTTGGGGGTTTPPRDVTPPRVLGVSLTTNRKTGRIAGLVIRFSEALDAGSAIATASYDLRPTTRKAGAIRLRSASYDPATHSVTLVPAGKLSAKSALRMTVQNIADPSRNLLDGDGNGSAGGAYTIVVRASRGG